MDGSKEYSIQDLLDVANYIFWHEKHSMWGGVKQPRVEEAFSRIVGIPVDTIRRVVRPDFERILKSED